MANEPFTVPGFSVPDTRALPESMAPLIRNAWYVIARSADIGRELRGIKALGESLVAYRTESGTPVVLDDRCAHRRFPLSKNRLEGDDIRCGYHGFKFAETGRCIWAPSSETMQHFGIRRYPCAEKGPWLWAWMGDPDRADPAEIPLPDYPAQWARFDGYKLNQGNYLLLIENLLDLTHLYFLHGAGDLAGVDAPLSAMEAPADGVAWFKRHPVEPVGAVAMWCGSDPSRLMSAEDRTRQHGPSLNTAERDWTPVDTSGVPACPAHFRVAHALTPVDETSTHQFYTILVSDAITMEVDQIKHFVENVVFEQDVEAIADIQATILSDRRSGTVEFSMPPDRFGFGMRKVLRRMNLAETNGQILEPINA